MRKASIVTLNGYFNYGNRLQNYALQETLKKFNLEVDTLRITRTPKKERIKPFLRDIRDQLQNHTNYKLEKERNRIFSEFSQQYINEQTTEYFLNDDLSFMNNDVDYFITGSDQVWNPAMNSVSSKYFLNFADQDKRIAYAPSFGVSEVSQNIAKKYSEWIDAIPYLSVREVEGAQLIKELTGRGSEVLVDPTMLLSKEEWLSISKRAKNRPDTPYLLTYFLGGPTDETRERLEEIAAEQDMTIINLGDITEKETYETGPGEFIDYINNASVFFVDSFHGVVFSIIFQVPFIVYKRVGGEAMYSRIETILNNFEMKNREVEGFSDDIFSMDFSDASEIIEKEYQKSMAFLSKALGIEE